jgi:hypothetical protein
MLRPIALAACAAVLAAAQPDTIDLRVEAQPLFTLIERIARQCDAGLSVHHAVQDRLAEEVTINARDARWADAVELLRRQYRLAVRLEGGRLLVEDAAADLRRQLVVVRHDIRPLLEAKFDRPGPSLSIPEPGGCGSMLLPPIEAAGPQVDTFIDTIRRVIAPAGWAEGTSMETQGGSLVVVQTPAVQRQIGELLQRMEAQILRQVQVRLWRLPVAEDAGPAVLDRAACLARIKGLGSPALVLVAGDDQQVHAFAGRQRNAVLDLDVVQERMDPIVTTLAAGLALDVKPLATRAGVLLTVRLDAATAAESGQTQVKEATGQPIASIEQPVQDLDSARCSVVVPDGGCAILRFGDRAYAIQAELFGAAALPPP